MFDRAPNYGALIVDSLRDDFLKKSIRETGRTRRLLDLGCGTRPYRAFYDHYTDHSVGTDVPHSPHVLNSIQVFSNAIALPFGDELFDVVFSTEVMEHVSEPEMMLKEIHRVLTPGGKLIMTTPFLVPVHEAPYDFFRYTIHGLQHLCVKANLDIIIMVPFGGMSGVLLSFIVQPQVKFWNLVARATRLRFLRGPWNPFVLLFVWLPQRLYVWIHRRFGGTALMQKILEKTSYTTKGYGFVAIKGQ